MQKLSPEHRIHNACKSMSTAISQLDDQTKWLLGFATIMNVRQALEAHESDDNKTDFTTMVCVAVNEALISVLSAQEEQKSKAE